MAINNYVPSKVFKSVINNKKFSYPLHIRKLYRAKASAWRRYKRFRTIELQQNYKSISSRCRRAVYAFTAKREEDIINAANLGKFF